METSDRFWTAPLGELKRGYSEEKDAFICLLCGKSIEKGIVYSHENVLYEAQRYMRIHIEAAHQSVFAYLIGMDKKLTGLTDHQKNLLQLFYQGKTDTEVQKELGIGSSSTIRHHRFALKEKERQAKTFLTIMELIKEKDEYAPAFIPIHNTATRVDERYNITQEEQEKMIKKYFAASEVLVLTSFPAKEKQRLGVLRVISKHLKSEYIYDEVELNQILKLIYEDYVLIRRCLVDYGFLDRTSDGSQYWVKK